MKITECYGLPFVTIAIEFRGQRLKLDNVLIDTGSASTLLNADIVRDIGIIPEMDDIVETIRGVGGVEYVYTKIINSIAFGETVTKDFQVEIGSMQYGLEMNGIIGFNLLKLVGAKIDVDAMEVIVV
jgi:predicted aspartyl protease